MIRSQFLSVFYFLFLGSSMAQFGSAPGGHPPWIKWRQIDTDTVRIVFPEELQSSAQRATNMIHYMYQNNRGSLGFKGGKVNILFRNQTLTPNGFVQTNPFSSEFFATPAIANFAGTIDWMDLLTIHEYRHVIQSHNARVGVTKLAHILAGEGAWWGMSALAIPNWFDEGDAVVQESALSSSGRGRLPKFLAGFKALSYEGKRYSYEKLRNGSLKNILPNHYPLGYLMSAYGRNQYGNEFWTNIYNDATRFKGIFFPFSKSLKNRVGLSTPLLYQTVMNKMDSIWQQDFSAPRARKAQALQVSRTPSKNTPTSYFFPLFKNDSQYLAVKSSFKEAPAVHAIDSTGKEKKMFALGASFDNYISYKSNKIVWSELAYHPRWDYVNYSVVKLYDCQTGLIRKLSTRSKYLTPDLAHHGQQIVVVDGSTDRKYRLVILAATTGVEMQTIPNPGNAFITYPRWSQDDQSIIAQVREGQKNALAEYDLATGKRRLLIPFTANLIEDVFVWRDYVFFTSGFTGTDNIFALKIGEQQIHQVTDVPVKAAYPSVSPDGRWLLYSETTANGRVIRKMRLNHNQWKAIRVVEPVDQDKLINPIAESEGGSILEKLPERDFPVRKYGWASHLIRPHSWAFLPEHPVYSLKLNSTNYLGTFNLDFGPEYNYNEDSFSWVTQATFSKLYPVFDVAYDSRSRRSGVFIEPDTVIARRWNESAIVGIARLPLDFSTSNYSRFVNLGVRYSHNRVNFIDVEAQDFNDSYNTLGAFFRINNFQFQARQEFNPRFGQSLSTGFRRTLGDDAGRLFYINGTLYFPGVVRTHSFYLSGGYQRQFAFNDYKFPNFFFNPRGYDGQIGLNDDIYRLGFNYSLPIWYPDFAVGPLAFIKRLRINVFYDYSKARLFDKVTEPIDFTYTSVGLELIGDLGLVRIFELPVGVRFSYLLDKPDFVEKNFSVGFIVQL